MSITVVVSNKDGGWIQLDRACFGFLSYINQWNSDDIEDHANFDLQNENDDEGITGFNSSDLQSVEYLAHSDEQTLAYLERAMARLPQYYKGATVRDGDYSNQKWFNFLLSDEEGKGLPMQPMVIGGMMVRNIVDYSSYNKGFLKLIEAGVPENIAFVICQAFPYRQNGLRKDLEGFYRNFGGDDTIFKGEARLCDLAAMINGELGDNWQGVFGDTGNGYGRYGDYDYENAPRSDRTTYRKDLADVTLITDKDVWSKSPLLNNAEELGVGTRENNDRIFIDVEDMVKVFVPKLQELLK